MPHTYIYSNLQRMNWLVTPLNYLFYCFYSFTFIDVVFKILFDNFNLGNATNFAQFILTIIGVFFAYYKLMAYIKDSKIKSAILEQDLIAKRNANFYNKWDKEFLDPFKKDKV